MQLSQSSRGSIELSIAMILSGTIGYFVVDSGQSAWNVVFFRCLFGAMALGLYGWYRGIFTAELLQAKLLLLIIIGGITLVGNWILLFLSFNYVPFSIATVAYHTKPLMLVIAGAWLIGERPSLHVYGWLAISFVGLFMIIQLDPSTLVNLFSNPSAENTGALFGLLLAIGAAALYANTTLLTKKTAEAPPHFVAFVQVTLGILMLAPFVNLDQLPTRDSAWLDLVILGVVHTCFMYILLYSSFQRLSTSLIAVLSFIYPVIALLVDHLAFGTQVEWLQGVGIVLILLAASAVKFDWPVLPSLNLRRQTSNILR